jgi:Lsr2
MLAESASLAAYGQDLISGFGIHERQQQGYAGAMSREPARAFARRHETACLPVANCLNRLYSFKEHSRPRWSNLMAQKIQTLFIDDTDGGEAEGTVRFALDGAEYEIDLSASHSNELRDALTNYITHARKVGGAQRQRAARGRRGAVHSLDTAKVREWAKENGFDIKDRGRVPAGVVEKYQASAGV